MTPTARYGIDIKGESFHTESDDLAHIHTFLHGRAGRVYVFDRRSRCLLFEGNVNEVRNAVGTLAELLQADGTEA